MSSSIHPSINQSINESINEWINRSKQSEWSKAKQRKSIIMASAVGTNFLWTHHNRELVRLRGSSCFAGPGGTIRRVPSDSYQPFRRVALVSRYCRQMQWSNLPGDWLGTISKYDFAVFYTKIDFVFPWIPILPSTPRGISWNFQVSRTAGNCDLSFSSNTSALGGPVPGNRRQAQQENQKCNSECAKLNDQYIICYKLYVIACMIYVICYNMLRSVLWYVLCHVMYMKS